MQNFKLFFQILNKYKGNMIMFVGIFLGVTIGVVNANKDQGNVYTSRTCSYVLYDADQSEISMAIGDYLKQTQKLVENIPNEKREIQDAIYSKEIACSVEIPAGYGERVLAGTGKELIEITTFAGSQEATLFETNLNTYVNTIGSYIRMGYDAKSAIEKANEVMDLSVEVSYPDGKSGTSSSTVHIFFVYLAWVMIMICVDGVGPVLIAFGQSETKKRISCSSCRFGTTQGSIFAGMFVVGISLTIFFTVMGSVVTAKIADAKVFFLEGMNLLAYAAVALSLVYLFGAITNKMPIMTMLANVSSLGMAFLCGIFVPIDLLADGIVKAARFLPAYWYAQAVDVAEQYGATKEYFMCLGIEVLFAIAIFVISLVVNRKNRVL